MIKSSLFIISKDGSGGKLCPWKKDDEIQITFMKNSLYLLEGFLITISSTMDNGYMTLVF